MDRWFVVLLLTAAPLVGCGFDDSQSPALVFADRDAAADRGSPEDAGAAADASDDGAVDDDAPAAPFTGSIVIDSTPPLTGASVAALFFSTSSPLATADPCNGAPVTGDCCAVSGGAGAAPTPLVTAGMLTVTDLDQGATIATLSPGSDGTYAVEGSAPSAWSPGDALQVSATGAPAGIDAFQGSVVAVAPFVATLPTVAALGQDLALAWTPDDGNPGPETVALAIAFASGDSIVCYGVDDATGALDVPGAVLSSVPSGAAGHLSLTRVAYTLGNADNATVSVVSRTVASTDITFQ